MKGYGGPESPSPTIGHASAAPYAALRNRSQHPARLCSQAARYADLETRGLAQMPLVPEGVLRAAGAPDRLSAVRQAVPYVRVHPDEKRSSAD
jgi:hypothetical protein